MYISGLINVIGLTVMYLSFSLVCPYLRDGINRIWPAPDANSERICVALSPISALSVANAMKVF